MIKESEKELRAMMQGGEDKDADIQIKRNI
jgi:hypothetical protein